MELECRIEVGDAFLNQELVRSIHVFSRLWAVVTQSLLTKWGWNGTKQVLKLACRSLALAWRPSVGAGEAVVENNLFSNYINLLAESIYLFVSLSLTWGKSVGPRPVKFK